jgi:hypothetical protein
VDLSFLVGFGSLALDLVSTVAAEAAGFFSLSAAFL